jgi:hypothetical protein
MKDLFRRHARLIAAALIIAVSVPAALALNVDQTRNVPTRFAGVQQTHYYRVTINFNDPNISTAQKFGRLPSRSFISKLECHVTTAFNAATTNEVTMGTSTTAIELFGTGPLNEASATYQNMTTANGLGLAATSAGEVDLYAKYAQTGTAATAGAVTCVIHYIPNNDM